MNIKILIYGNNLKHHKLYQSDIRSPYPLGKIQAICAAMHHIHSIHVTSGPSILSLGFDPGGGCKKLIGQTYRIVASSNAHY